MMDGYIPTSPKMGARLTIVCGAPLSGKTTYVERHRAAGDAVIDFDEVVQDNPDATFAEAYRIRDERLESARSGNAGVWLVIGAPSAWQRQTMRHYLRPGRIIVIETPRHVCLTRAKGDPRDIDRAIERWWNRYERDIRDHVVTEKGEG